MKHHKSIRKLGRKTNQREALLRSLAESLIVRGKISTTQARAKELRPFIEKLTTLARKDGVATRRLLVSRLKNPKVAKKLQEEVAPKYKGRAGGYTRITKVGTRAMDAAPRAIIEFVE